LKRSTRSQRNGNRQFEPLELRALLNAAPIAIDDAYQASAGTALHIGAPGNSTGEIVAAGSTWKFLGDGSNQGSAWRLPVFNDSNWSTGTGQFGFGDGDEATDTSAASGGARPVTTYFRREFQVATPPNGGTLTLGLQYDDGAAVYLNGVEIARTLLPANPTYQTLATAAAADDGQTFSNFTVPAALLLAGRNVLAVEVHQVNIASSDMSFDLRLAGEGGNAAPTGVLQNDTDADGDALTAVLVGAPSHGTVQLSANGAFVYSPTAGYVGEDSFTYRANDGTTNSNTASVAITVAETPGNHPPVGVADVYTTPMDQPLVVASPAAANSPRIYQSAALGGIGRFGGPSVSNSQILAARFHLNQATTTAHIGGVFGGSGTIYGAIVALTGPEDFPDSTDLSSADVLGAALLMLPDGNAELIATPLEVRLSPGWYAIAFGTGRFGATGDGYAPMEPGAFGGSGTYEQIFSNQKFWNSQFGYSSHYFLDGPSTPSGLLSNDTDADGDALTAQLIANPVHGAVTVAPNGTFTYTPDAGYSGADAFRYRPSDGQSQGNETTVSIQVGSGVVARGDSYTATEDIPLDISAALGVLANDTGDLRIAQLITGPLRGTVTLAGDGSFHYVPRADFAGVDRFLYRVRSGAQFSAPAEVTITVSPVNDPPVARADTYHVETDGLLTAGAPSTPGKFVYLADGNTSKISRVELATGDREVMFVAPAGPAAIAVDSVGNWLYWSTGAAEYRIYRSRPDGSERQMLVQLPVWANCSSNCTPTATDLAVDPVGGKMYWTSGGGNNIPGRIWRANLDGTQVETIITQGTYPQSIALDVDRGYLYWSDHGAGALYRAKLNGSDVRTIISDANELRGFALDLVGGQIVYAYRSTSFQYGIWKANLDGTNRTPLVQPVESDPADIAIDALRRMAYWTNAYEGGISRAGLDGQFSGLVFRDGASAVSSLAIDQYYGSLHPFSVLANDGDADGQPLVAQLLSQPQHGTVQFSSDGSFVYTPAAGYRGSDAFTYSARNTTNGGETAQATVTIQVGGVNHVPVAENDSYSTLAGQTLVVGTNTTDPPTPTPILIPRGSIWNYKTGAVGVNWQSAAFDVSQWDSGHGPLGYGDVQYVTQLPAQPSGNAPYVTAYFRRTITLDNPAWATLRFGLLSDDGAVVYVNGQEVYRNNMPSGEITSTTLASATAEDEQEYVEFSVPANLLAAGENVIAVEVHNVSVQSSDLGFDLELTADGSILAQPGGVLANDEDEDGDRLTAVLVNPPEHGTLQLSANGSFVFTPAAGFIGTTSFTYRANDGMASSNIATVTIRVIGDPPPTNHPPVARDDNYAFDPHANPGEPPSNEPIVAAARLLALDAVEDSRFGESVAIDNGFAVVGAPRDDQAGADAGAAYVFRRANGGWQFVQKLLPTSFNVSEVAGGLFGSAVSIYGDQILVGAPMQGATGNEARSGAVYIYGRVGDAWTQRDEYAESDEYSAACPRRFGAALDQDANGFIVGAPSCDGAAYVYSNDPTSPGPFGVLQDVDDHSDGAADEQFGASVALDGNLVAVGAPGKDARGVDSGAVIVYEQGNFAWHQVASMVGAGAGNHDQFGTAVDLQNGDRPTVIMGARDAENVYVFGRTNTSDWVEQAAIEAPASAGSADAEFGASLALRGDELLVGAPGASVGNQTQSGVVVAYRRSGNQWVAQSTYISKASPDDDRFGHSVAIDKHIAGSYFAGAPVYSGGRGSAYSFAAVNVTSPGSLIVPAEGGVLANDSDPDHDPLTAQLVAGPQHGSVQLAANGSFVYTPAANFTGGDQFSYRATDSHGATAQATVRIAVGDIDPGDAQITGVAWRDANGDGLFTAGSGDAVMANVAVRLLSGAGVTLATQITDAAGRYAFHNIPAAVGRIAVDLPSGYQFTRFGASDGAIVANAMLDSDIHRATGRSSYLSVGDGTQIVNVGLFTGPYSDDVVDNLRISEVQSDNDAGEFIELTNIGAEPLDLTGVRFTDGVAFEFTGAALSTIFPGEYIIVSRESTSEEYPFAQGEIEFAGQFLKKLSRDGERIVLVDRTNDIVQEFTYDGAWFALAHDGGFSIVARDPRQSLELWNSRDGWRLSAAEGGSPGLADVNPAPLPGSVVINEVMSRDTNSKADWVELYNTTDAAIDISYWYLGDYNRDGVHALTDNPQFRNFRIPANTIIPAHGYVVFDSQTDFDVYPRTNNGLSSFGDGVFLSGGDSTGRLLGYSESVNFGASRVGVSFGRYQTSTGENVFTAQIAPSRGAENLGPGSGPVVINELMYHPAYLHDEFIELQNTSNAEVVLHSPPIVNAAAGWTIESAWQLTGDIDYRFSEGDTLPAGGYALVVAMEPADFRAKYHIDDSVQIFGPYGGELDNSGGLVELTQFQGVTAGAENVVSAMSQPRVISIDRVAYDDRAPWPEEADLGGASLERISGLLFGDDPINWAATTVFGGTPGAMNSVSAAMTGDFNGDHQVNAGDIDLLFGALRSAAAPGDGFRAAEAVMTSLTYDLTGDFTVDRSDADYLISHVLGTAYGDADLNGRIDMRDLLQVRNHLTAAGGWTTGDFDGNGLVNRADLSALVSNFGFQAAASSASASAAAIVVRTSPRAASQVAARRVAHAVDRAIVGRAADEQASDSDDGAPRFSARSRRGEGAAVRRSAGGNATGQSGSAADSAITAMTAASVRRVARG
jgi:hypothetical protein